MSNHKYYYLLLSLSGIGNYLMQSSVFRAIKTHQPDASITVWVAPRNTAVLAKANPDIDHVIKAPIRRSLPGHLSQIIKLRRLSADVGLVLYPGQHWKSSGYLFLSGIDHRVGHRFPHLGNPDSSLLLSAAVPVNPQLHDVEQNQALLPPLSIPITDSLKPYYVHIPPYHSRQAINLLYRIRHAPGADKILVGLHPGSAPDFSWKRWPLSNFASVSRSLIKRHHAHILIFGGTQELPIMKQLRHLIGSQHSSIIHTHLLTVGAVISHCRLFIANDSGLMHLSAGLSVPTIGLFGPTDELRTGPRGIGSAALRAPGTSPVYDVNTNFSLGDEPHPTMLSITPSQVLAAADKTLGSSTPKI